MATNLPKTSELAAAAIRDDKALANQLKSLVSDIIKHQRMIMLVGTPAEKAALVKAVLPQMLAAMGTAAQDEAAAAEEDAYQRMLARLRGELPDSEVPQSLRAVS